MSLNWRYLIFDMKTFQVLAEITEVGDPFYTEEINGPGSFSVTIPMNPLFAENDFPVISYTDIEIPRAGLAIERNSDLVAAGPIITQAFNFDSGTIQLNAMGIFELMKRRICFHNHYFWAGTASSANGWVSSANNGIGWDQSDIVKFFLNEMQQEDHGVLNIDVSGIAEHGILRVYQMFASDLKSYHDLILDRANIINGFDFKFTPRWKDSIRNGEVEWIFEMFNPPEGRETNLLFQYGGNVSFQSMQVDGSQVCYSAYSQGSSQQNSSVIGFDSDTAQMAANYRLEYVDRSHTDVIELATSNAYAQQARSLRKKPAKIPTIVAPIELSQEFIIGDQVHIVADSGLLQLDEMFRIVNFTCHPKGGVVNIAVSPLSIRSG